MFCFQGHSSAPLAPTVPLTPPVPLAGAAPALPTPKNASKPARKKGRPAALPFKEGLGWCIRFHYKGNDVYLSGYKTDKAVNKAAAARRADIDNHVAPRGFGAEKTTVAQALQDYAVETLPFLKGAKQEAVRMNNYLRFAGLQTLVVTPCSQAAALNNGEANSAYFAVTLKPHTLKRVIPNGLAQHRKAQLTKNARTEKYRAVLAGTTLLKVGRYQLQELVNAMRRDGNAAATIALERSMFRVLFNYAFSFWNWADLRDNPAKNLKMPKIENERKRVMSLEEQTLLDAALQQCRNELVAPLLTLLRETAMRVSEPLEHARWSDVDWSRCVLCLSDGKDGRREVPLSPVAIQVLRDLQPGEPGERIVKITYDALKKAMERACVRAGIKNLKIHDLRRTAATRMALKTGNLFLVKALTGHKTDVMAQRYLQVGADDVVNIMHAEEKPQTSQANVTQQVVDAAAFAKDASVVSVPAVSAAPAAAMQTSMTITAQQLHDAVSQAVASALAGNLQGARFKSPEAPEAAKSGMPEGTAAKTATVVQLRRAA